MASYNRYSARDRTGCRDVRCTPVHANAITAGSFDGIHSAIGPGQELTAGILRMECGQTQTHGEVRDPGSCREVVRRHFLPQPLGQQLPLRAGELGEDDTELLPPIAGDYI